MVEDVFRRDDIRADAIMTPRVDVIWLRVDAGRAEILTAVKSGHGAFAVCETTIDNVRGVVHLFELTRALLEYEELDPGGFAAPPEVIPESANAADLSPDLVDLRRHNRHQPDTEPRRTKCRRSVPECFTPDTVSLLAHAFAQMSAPWYGHRQSRLARGGPAEGRSE